MEFVFLLLIGIFILGFIFVLLNYPDYVSEKFKFYSVEFLFVIMIIFLSFMIVKIHNQEFKLIEKNTFISNFIQMGSQTNIKFENAKEITKSTFHKDWSIQQDKTEYYIKDK